VEYQQAYDANWNEDLVARRNAEALGSIDSLLLGT